MNIMVDLDFNIEAAAGDKLTGICHHSSGSLNS